MLRLIAIATLLCSCFGGDDGALPDAAPDAPVCIYDEATECSAISRTPDCYWDPCEDPLCRRTCDTERICQAWPDCTSPTNPEPHECFQCRHEVTCWCG